MIEKWFEKFDLYLFFLLILFAAISLVTLFNVQSLGLSNSDYWKQQAVFYVVSLFLFIGMTFLDLSILKKQSIFLYLFCLILLSGILILPESISPEINGAKGWYRIGPFSLQPAELMKIGFILVLSYIAEKHDYQQTLKNEFQLMFKMLIFLIPIIIILVIYPDLGSLLTHIFIFLCILIVSKIRLKTIMIYVLSLPSCLFIYLFLTYKYSPEFFFNKILSFLPSYQAQRFYGWLKPEEYIASGYQLKLSITSIGAGQLNGHTTIGDVPYAYSDFIFAVIGARYGFIGASIIIMLFFLLIFKIITISLNTNEDFGKYVGAGVVGLITYHVFQNIGMSIGLIPVTGIGLPFISYGGSALITCMIAMGHIMSLKMHTRKYMF